MIPFGKECRRRIFGREGVSIGGYGMICVCHQEGNAVCENCRSIAQGRLRHHPKQPYNPKLLRHGQNGELEAPSTTLAEPTGKIAPQLDGSRLEIPWRMALAP